MQATRFEFEHRFRMIGIIFGAGFCLYAIDWTICFAVTLNMRAAGILFFVSFIVYFTVVPLIKRRAST